MATRHIRMMVVVGTASFTLAAAIVTAQGDPLPQSISGPSSEQPPVTVVDPQLADNFALFRRQQRADEPLVGTGPFGANLALARRADTGVGSVWVVPGRGVVCLRAADSVGSGWACATTAEATSGVLMLTMREALGDSGRLFGVLPDGASHAELDVDAHAVALDVGPDAVFGARTDQPSMVGYDDGGERRTTAAP